MREICIKGDVADIVIRLDIAEINGRSSHPRLRSIDYVNHLPPCVPQRGVAITRNEDGSCIVCVGLRVVNSTIPAIDAKSPPF